MSWCRGCHQEVTPENMETATRCITCRTKTKAKEAAYRKNYGKQYSKSTTGREKRHAFNKRRYANDPVHCRLESRTRKYGLSIDQYHDLVESQDNKCACCKRPFTTKTHIDHCHVTLRVRGIICHSCNTGLGLLGDNIEGLEKALSYLKKTS